MSTLDLGVMDATGMDAIATDVPVVCGGVECAAGEICCFATGRCFDPVSDPTACGGPTADSGTPPHPGDVACSSNADCSPDEYCNGPFCLGGGFCAPRNNCTSTAAPICGCDGVSYANADIACMRGIRISLVSGCGCGVPNCGESADSGVSVPIACGVQANCPSGMDCCTLLGMCVPSGCTDCCRFPPPGTRFPCETTADCRTGEYCAGDGCGGGGGCTFRPVNCTGVVQYVCGCDGLTYENSCWANAAGTRVRAMGSCPDGG